MYNDVDGIVVSGLAHDLNPDAVAEMMADSYPAQLDPKFTPMLHKKDGKRLEKRLAY